MNNKTGKVLFIGNRMYYWKENCSVAETAAKMLQRWQFHEKGWRVGIPRIFASVYKIVCVVPVCPAIRPNLKPLCNSCLCT